MKEKSRHSRQLEYKCPYCEAIFTNYATIGGHINGHKKRGDALQVVKKNQHTPGNSLSDLLRTIEEEPKFYQKVLDRFAQNANFMVIRIPDAEIEVGIVEHLGDEE